MNFNRDEFWEWVKSGRQEPFMLTADGVTSARVIRVVGDGYDTLYAQPENAGPAAEQNLTEKKVCGRVVLPPAFEPFGCWDWKSQLCIFPQEYRELGNVNADDIAAAAFQLMAERTDPVTNEAFMAAMPDAENISGEDKAADDAMLISAMAKYPADMAVVLECDAAGLPEQSFLLGPLMLDMDAEVERAFREWRSTEGLDSRLREWGMMAARMRLAADRVGDISAERLTAVRITEALKECKAMRILTVVKTDTEEKTLTALRKRFLEDLAEGYVHPGAFCGSDVEFVHMHFPDGIPPHAVLSVAKAGKNGEVLYQTCGDEAADTAGQTQKEK